MDYIGSAFETGKFFQVLIYDFQSLIAGFLAIIAAVFGATPVWRQLKHTNIQTQILRREVLALQRLEAQQELMALSEELDPILQFLEQETCDFQGNPVHVSGELAHRCELMISGSRYWKRRIGGLDNCRISEEHDELSRSIRELVDNLNLAYYTDNNDRINEDRAFSEEEWNVLVQKSEEARKIIHDNVADFRIAKDRLISSINNKIIRLTKSIVKIDHAIDKAGG